MDSLKELSERARVCTNPEWRALLKEIHAELDKALDRLWREPTAAHMRDANALWARAHVLYKKCPPDADPQPPLSGAPTAALLAA